MQIYDMRFAQRGHLDLRAQNEALPTHGLGISVARCRHLPVHRVLDVDAVKLIRIPHGLPGQYQEVLLSPFHHPCLSFPIC
jgi:hypothetical protein